MPYARFFTDSWRDVLLAWRSLRRSPLVALVAIASIGLGIGANTAIFSVVNSLLLRQLPVREPARLVLLSDSSYDHVRAGVAAGTMVSVWASRFVRSLLYRVDPGDLRTLAVSILVLCVVAAIATWLPTRRAVRTEPGIVLHES
jgi:hypothetical protein